MVQTWPRQTTADYLTGCTDPNERQYAPGRSAQDTPSTPEMLEQAYLRSKCDNAADLKEYKLFMVTEKSDQETFRTAVAADKKERCFEEQSLHTWSYRPSTRLDDKAVSAKITGQISTVHKFFAINRKDWSKILRTMLFTCDDFFSRS